MRKPLLLFAFFISLTVAHSQSLDPSFAGKGYTAVNFPAGNFNFESGGQVLRKSDGSYYVLFHVNGFPVLTRHFANGDRDLNFGTGGYSQTINISDAQGALQPDGKIVVAGQTADSATGTTDFAVARFNTNGTIDKSFAGDGLQSINFFNDDDAVNAILVQPNGKIVVGGRAYDPATGRPDFALARLNASGTPDPSYDGDGKQTTDFSGNSEAINAISIDPFGKIVAAGDSYDPETGFSRMAAARYNTDGSPDKTFSDDGKTTTGFAGQDAYASSLAVQENGKIILAGQIGETFFENSAIALVRYNTNGTLDNAFDGDGKVTTNLFDSTATATSIALQSDGEIVIGGYGDDPNTGNADFIIARYNTNGTLDKSFDKDGFTSTDFYGEFDEIHSIIIQPDGKIVASGQAFNTKAGNGDYALVRYDADGSPDKKFGRKGVVTGYYEASESRMNAVAVLRDGKVVVAGGTFVDQNVSDFGLTRYNANGTVDKSFGENGVVTTDFLNDYDEAVAVAIQPDGKIVVAGVSFSETAFSNEFAVARYHADGSLDKKFGRKGKIVTNLLADNTFLGGFALQPDGKIILAGSVSYRDKPGSNVILFRYTAGGEPDNSFGGDGNVITDFLSLSDETATAVAVQRDGKIVASGYGFSSTSSNFILARYNSNGSLDKAFDNDGKVLTTFSSDVYGLGMVIQKDGKIVVGGEYYHYDTNDDDFALARYNGNGSLDESFDTDGKVVTDIGGVDNSFVDMALQQDETIVLLGAIYNTANGQDNVSLTRYTSTGTLDKSFDGDGTLLTQFFGYYNYPTSLAIRNNNAFVTGNTFTPAQTGFVSSFRLGSVGSAPPVANQQLKSTVEKMPAVQLSVKAQPNPSTQYFTLVVQSKTTTPVIVRVSDAAGRLVETKTKVSSDTVLQLGHHYKPGVYYAEVVQGTSKSVVTLVKQ